MKLQSFFRTPRYFVPIHVCVCGEDMECLDDYRHSELHHCPKCHATTLAVNTVERSYTLRLDKYYERRMVAGAPWPMFNTEAVMELMSNIKNSTIPCPLLEQEFGILSWQHMRHLRLAIRRGLTQFDLHHALGRGSAITNLVRIANGSISNHLSFRTSSDASGWLSTTEISALSGRLGKGLDAWLGHKIFWITAERELKIPSWSTREVDF